MSKTGFEFLSFDILICLEFRISDFGFFKLYPYLSNILLFRFNESIQDKSMKAIPAAGDKDPA